MSRPFKELSSKIDRGFAELTTLSSPQERRVAASARARWEQVFAAASIAASLPSDRYGVKLDEFHDVIDEAGSLVADAYTLNLNQVADEISSVQQRERRQLWTALAILVTSLIAAGLLGRRVYRSITTPLALLERAASQFDSDELSHRISVTGDDELARLSRAFNDMAGKLQRSRDELHSQARHDP